MDYKIVADSSCDLNKDIIKGLNIELIPFNISIEAKEFRDDKNIDMDDLVESMLASPNPIKTSCPSPGEFLESYEKGKDIFVVTISKEVSGTYNSAILARNMALKKDPDRFIHVFNSKGASVTETLIVLKIKELREEGLANDIIVERVDDYIEELETYFISEDLSNLIKNGRMSKAKGLVATVLNLKPIMGADEDGNIRLVENIRGSKKAFEKLVDLIGESKRDFKKRILAISHANAAEKAKALKEEIKKRYDFKDIIIVETKGLSTVYVNHEGIILAF